jgi:hypothetical protein
MARTKFNSSSHQKHSTKTTNANNANNSSQKQQQNSSSYQSLYLWVSFLWSLITLGMVGQRVGVQAQTLPATLDLASLMATQGMVIQGAVAGDNAGYSVSSAGDVNGDGINDLLVGAQFASPVSRTQAGVAYLIYGRRALSAVLDLNAMTATQGMVIQGAAAYDFAGTSVSSAGDFNGDNITDLVVGAYRASPVNRTQAGAAYLIYGSRTLSAVLDLNTLTATQGMVIQGATAYGFAGYSLSSAGDVNGDNITDLLVGAKSASSMSRTQAGAAYLIYGSRTLSAVLDLNALTATQGMVIQGGASNDNAGYSVASAVDVNGDGLSDLLVGAHGASFVRRSRAGAVYLIYGSRALSAVLDLNALTSTQGMVIQGAAANDYAGSSVSSAGDVNGDGLSDLVVGASQASPLSRSGAGAAYLIYGRRALSAVLDLNALTSTQGMVIQGAVVDDEAGYSVASAGDVNGDGLSDLLIGAYLASPLNRGQAGGVYLIYGSKTLPAVLDLNALNATQGMVIQGAVANDYAGSSVSSAGDVNGDGINDLVVGAWQASPLSRSQAGAAYLIYGKSAIIAMSLMTTNSLGTTTSSAITVTTKSTVSMTGPSLSSGATMTAASQTSLSLHNGSILTSANSASSDTLRGSGESTTTVTEIPIQTTSAGQNSGISGTVIGAAAGGGGFALAACLGAVGFYAYRKKSQANKTNNVISNEQGVALKNTESYQQLPLAPANQKPQNDYGIYTTANSQRTVASNYSGAMPPGPSDPYAQSQWISLDEANRDVAERMASEQQKAAESQREPSNPNYDDISPPVASSDNSMRPKS